MDAGASDDGLFVGIDPGKDGAIAALNQDSCPMWIIDMPTANVGRGTKREYDVSTLAGVLKHPHIKFVCVEKQQPRKNDGKASAFGTGLGYGVLLGILGALKIPHTIVTPQAWQKTMLAGMPGKGTKGRSVLKACQLWPETEHELKGPRGGIKDGRSDALLIAEYGRKLRG